MFDLFCVGNIITAQTKAVDNITYYVYDTLKGYKTDDWSVIKQFATDLKELTNELKMSGFAVFQLSDDTVFTDVFILSVVMVFILVLRIQITALSRMQKMLCLLVGKNFATESIKRVFY